PVFLRHRTAAGRIDKKALISICRLANLGVVCGLVSYRAKSQFPYATPIDALEDCASAVRYVRFYQEKLNIDVDKIAVVGAGSGGNLAGCLSLGLEVPPAEKDRPTSCEPNAAILISSIVDIKKGSIAERAFPDPMMAKQMSLTQLIDQNPTSTPIQVIHGTADRAVPIEDVDRLAQKLDKRKGDAFDYRAFEGRDSNFFNLNTDPASYEASLTVMTEFLCKHGILPEGNDPHDALLVSWREKDF
ncbi:MAG: alpha/beta hydrolase, partial [Verrucomicrobiota bacterium]